MKTTSLLQGSAFSAIMILQLSCNTMRPILLESPEAAPVAVSDKIQSLLLLNNTPSYFYADNNDSLLQAQFYSHGFNYDSVIYDLNVVDTLLIRTGELLFESGRFDYVVPADRFYFNDENSDMPMKLSWKLIGSLCKQYKTDAVLSLDYYFPRVSISLKRKTYLSQINKKDIKVYEAELSVFYQSVFRLNDAFRKMTNTLIINDSMKWVGYNYDIIGSLGKLNTGEEPILPDSLTQFINSNQLADLFSTFPGIKKALMESGIEIAQKLTKQISPQWYPEIKQIYAGNRKFEAANEFLDQNDWEGAIAEWNKIEASARSKSLRKMAVYNISVGYEIMGDLHHAINWSLKQNEDLKPKPRFHRKSR